MDNPSVKRQIEQLMEDPQMFSWIRQIMPALLEQHPIEAQAQVEYLLQIIRKRTDQYFGPDAPLRWTE